jgi:hypothetical protein
VVNFPIGGIDDGCSEGRIGTKGDVELERRLKPQQETGTIGCCSHIGIDRESGTAFGIRIGIGGSLKGGRAKEAVIEYAVLLAFWQAGREAQRVRVRKAKRSAAEDLMRRVPEDFVRVMEQI